MKRHRAASSVVVAGLCLLASWIFGCAADQPIPVSAANTNAASTPAANNAAVTNTANPGNAANANAAPLTNADPIADAQNVNAVAESQANKVRADFAQYRKDYNEALQKIADTNNRDAGMSKNTPPSAPANTNVPATNNP